MAIINRKAPRDVLFLMPVRLEDEKLPRGKIRMLYCDAAGKLYASLINRSVYENALDIADRMERRRKPFATLGLETAPGTFTPAAVEINDTEEWALEHILEHALKKGMLPDILKRHLKPIIKRGELNRETALSEHKKHRRRSYEGATPGVLDRLPYYHEHDIEFSLPIYKAEYSYPLIVLKRLQSNEPVPSNTTKLLILDSAGDLAITKVSSKLMYDLEKGLREYKIQNNRNVCAILLQGADGLAANYMVISQLQKKALDTITRYFEETGQGKHPLPAAARTVLNRAREKLSPPVK